MFEANDSLAGIRILDLSRLLPGPACTWYLQGMGASVDRVESLNGDLTRFIPPFIKGVGAYFYCFSRGKRSLSLDTRHPLSVEIIKTLIGHYDVLVEGFKPGVLEAMGLAPEDLLKKYPSLVIARISGYGQTGPLFSQPGHDINYISMTGMLSAQLATSKEIALPAVQIADMCGALTAAMAISAALVKRFRTGIGQVLDISLTDSALALAGPMLVGAVAEQRELRPGGEALSGGASFYRCYLCSDGHWVAVGAIEPKFQRQLQSVFGGISEEILTKGFLSQSSVYWEETLKEACVTRVRLAKDIFTEPQHLSRNRISGWDIHPPIGQVLGGTPLLGEGGRMILSEANVPSELIQQSLNAGVLKLAQDPDESGAQAESAAPTT